MRRVTPGLVDDVVADAVVGVGAAVGGWGGFGAGVVDGGRGRLVGQGPVRAVVVVVLGERIEQGLQLCHGPRLGGLGAQPLLQGLLEPLDLPAGGGVVGSGVLLDDV